MARTVLSTAAIPHETRLTDGYKHFGQPYGKLVRIRRGSDRSTAFCQGSRVDGVPGSGAGCGRSVQLRHSVPWSVSSRAPYADS
jgi:hypothetical protein